MPRKTKYGKRQRLSAHTKEKQIAQLKLMQINFRLDDHVYRNNPIYPERAENYIQEITALKAQCHDDMRLLQVVEKLTRIMKQIIAEEVDKSNADTGRNTLSNVNSTTMKHVEDLSKSAAESKTGASEISLLKGRKVTINNIDTTLDATESIDLPEDRTAVNENKYPENIEKEHAIVTEVSRALSNLPVQEVETPFNENSLNDKFSNGDNSSDNQNKKEQLESCGQGFEEYDKFLPDLHKSTKDVNEDTAISSNTQLNGSSEAATNTNAQVHIHDEVTTVSKNNFPGVEIALPPIENETQNNNAKMNKTKISKETILTEITKQKGVTKISTGVDTKPKSRKFKPPINKPDKKINKTTKGQLKRVVSMKNETKPGKLAMDDDKIRTVSHNQPVASSSKDSNVPKKMEVDLSWVENIKYVRQIDDKEYVPATDITDTLWNSVDFPSNWNDNEFNY